jgi:hypothetical protein
MKYGFSVSIFLLLLAISAAFAAGSQTIKAGKYTVMLATHPSPATVGENHVTLTVKDGDKPVSGADVSLHLDMVSMSMPADVVAKAGEKAGEYVATVDLGMAGQWKLAATVHGMAGMTMAGDGTGTFTITAASTTGSAASPAMPAATPPSPIAPAGLPWPLCERSCERDAMRDLDGWEAGTMRQWRQGSQEMADPDEAPCLRIEPLGQVRQNPTDFAGRGDRNLAGEGDQS